MSAFIDIDQFCSLSSAEEYQEITSKFSNNRAQLPTLFIATPKDKFTSLWTKDKPTTQVCFYFFHLPIPLYLS